MFTAPAAAAVVVVVEVSSSSSVMFEKQFKFRFLSVVQAYSLLPPTAHFKVTIYYSGNETMETCRRITANGCPRTEISRNDFGLTLKPKTLYYGVSAYTARPTTACHCKTTRPAPGGRYGSLITPCQY